MIFYNKKEFVTIVNLFPFQIYLYPKTKLTTASIRTRDRILKRDTDKFPPDFFHPDIFHPIDSPPVCTLYILYTILNLI